jgi:hypothetical protein
VIVVQDLFSVAHITEDDVLAFVASEGSAYSVEQKQGKMVCIMLVLPLYQNICHR